MENYYKPIKPYVEVKTKPLDIETVPYEPTAKEKQEYEKLKKEVILEKKYPKVKVLRLLNEYVESTSTKKKALRKTEEGILNVTENTAISRKAMYKDILLTIPRKIVFYSSGYYGADEIELSRTRDALKRHNTLLELLKNG